MKILYLTTVIPSPKKTGGEIASQSFIDTLERNGHQVTVVGYERQGDKSLLRDNEVSVEKRCIETSKSFLQALIWMFISLYKNLPYSCAKYYSFKYTQTLKKIIQEDTYNLIIIDHAQLSWIGNLISDKIKNIIFIAHNIEHETYLAQSKSATNKLLRMIYRRECYLIKSCEDNLASIAKQVWTLTRYDCKYFSQSNQNTKVFDIPASINPSLKCISIKSFDIGIIGSWTWNANLLGLKWFFQQVYPFLPEDISIHVAGKGAEWLNGEYTNVKYCGFVPDVQAFMSQARVIAIPSVAGGGIQIKTLDAIASDSPIVVTPIALRGIFEYPSYIKIAQEASEFADTLIASLNFSNTKEDFRIQLLHERIDWLKSRQQQFFQRIGDAISHI